MLTTGAAVTMPWLDDVAAAFEAWYPGQEQGSAVAALLFGDENFTGKLPISWPRDEAQVTEGLGITNPWNDITSRSGRPCLTQKSLTFCASALM